MRKLLSLLAVVASVFAGSPAEGSIPRRDGLDDIFAAARPRQAAPPGRALAKPRFVVRNVDFEWALGVGLSLSNDPLGYVDGPNLYAAFKGNPASFVDPMGTAVHSQAEFDALPKVLRECMVVNGKYQGYWTAEELASQASWENWNGAAGFALDVAPLAEVTDAARAIAQAPRAALNAAGELRTWWRWTRSPSAPLYEAGPELVKVAKVGTETAERAAADGFARYADAELNLDLLPQNRTEMEDAVRQLAGSADMRAEAANIPRTSGRHGTRAHVELEDLANDLNGALTDRASKYTLGVEEFRDVGGQVTGRRVRGSKGLDIVVYESGSAVLGFDLKTGKLWTMNELRALEQRFGVTIIQVQTR